MLVWVILVLVFLGNGILLVQHTNTRPGSGACRDERRLSYRLVVAAAQGCNRYLDIFRIVTADSREIAGLILSVDGTEKTGGRHLCVDESSDESEEGEDE